MLEEKTQADLIKGGRENGGKIELEAGEMEGEK